MAQFYSFAQLEALWIQAGGDRASAPIMAAIALAESSGNPVNTNRNSDGTIDRGLWQINSSNVDSTSMFNPMLNAKEAVKLKNNSLGLRNWVTYTNGAYRQYLKSNVPPDTSGLPTGSTPTATDSNFDPFGGIGGDLGGAIGDGFASAFKALLQPTIEVALWGGEVLLGIGLMLGGTILFAMNTNTGKNATTTATGEIKGLTGAALSAAAPETAPELAALSRIRTAQGRRAIVRQRAKEAAQNSPRGQRIAAQQREKKVQAEQKSQTERAAIRQEASRRNRGNSGTGNRKSKSV